MSGIIAQNSGRHTGLVKASSGGGGVWNLIKTYTASDDANLTFVDGTDGVDFSAYDEFVFKFYDLNPATDGGQFSFNFTTDGTNYNTTKTSTAIECYHAEDDSATVFLYRALGLAQSTGNQVFMVGIGNGSDECGVGYLQLFAPGSTTFVKHFIADCNFAQDASMTFTEPTAGYINTTSAVTGARFLMHSGNFDGTISLFGIT